MRKNIALKIFMIIFIALVIACIVGIMALSYDKGNIEIDAKETVPNNFNAKEVVSYNEKPVTTSAEKNTVQKIKAKIESENISESLDNEENEPLDTAYEVLEIEQLMNKIAELTR